VLGLVVFFFCFVVWVFVGGFVFFLVVPQSDAIRKS